MELEHYGIQPTICANVKRIGPTASEEMSFENVDGRRTDDGRRIPPYTISSPMSLRLR